MSTTNEVEIWVKALNSFNNGQFNEAISFFQNLSPSARILYNVGICYLCIEQRAKAIEKLEYSIKLDVHFALAYAMLAQLMYEERRLEDSQKFYEETFSKCRGNQFIEYKPLGLKYQLYASEILINQAIIYHQKNNIKSRDLCLKKALYFASNCRDEKTESLAEEIKIGRSLDILKVPTDKVFQPDPGIMKNYKKKDYLGEAQVVATQNKEESYACFSGLKVANSPKGQMKIAKENRKPLRPPPPKTKPEKEVVTDTICTPNRPQLSLLPKVSNNVEEQVTKLAQSHSQTNSNFNDELKMKLTKSCNQNEEDTSKLINKEEQLNVLSKPKPLPRPVRDDCSEKDMKSITDSGKPKPPLRPNISPVKQSLFGSPQANQKRIANDDILKRYPPNIRHDETKSRPKVPPSRPKKPPLKQSYDMTKSPLKIPTSNRNHQNHKSCFETHSEDHDYETPNFSLKTSPLNHNTENNINIPKTQQTNHNMPLIPPSQRNSNATQNSDVLRTIKNVPNISPKANIRQVQKPTVPKRIQSVDPRLIHTNIRVVPKNKIIPTRLNGKTLSEFQKIIPFKIPPKPCKPLPRFRPS